MDRAYAIFEVKGLDDRPDGVSIRGIASTPTLDQQFDILEPMGAKFSLPMPLFLYHDSKQTVGRVEVATPTAESILFQAFVPFIKEAGRLKDRVDEAIHMLKYKLIHGVSVGLTSSAKDVEYRSDGVRRVKKWNWHELSLVPIPANAEATLLDVKALCAPTGADVVRISPLPRSSGAYAVPLTISQEEQQS